MIGHRGWSYVYEDDKEPEEVRKRSHWACSVIHGDVQLDVSPYAGMTQAAFAALVDMGFPRRRGIGPLTLEQVAELHREYLGAT